MLFNVRVRAAEIVCMGIVRVHIKCSHITVIDGYEKVNDRTFHDRDL